MSYLNKIWMAASFVAVQGNADHGVKLKSGIISAHRLQRRLSSVVDEIPAEERRRSSSSDDSSLRQVMYLNCWSQG
ncbi:hypothetical protein AALP_AA3G046000 [Arabis alpina]|uniref:Wound-responsive family protein n=1 Tax=Arabis alpina TaxID=50452 RepID=A0A087H709_ARAAL|nr:hypothetical protein AALP_AA3G046000 [Arabis alpina]